MSAIKTAFRFFGITLYFVLMGPVFALCTLIAEDVMRRVASGSPLPHFRGYVFVLTMYWPSVFIDCLVPGTIVGYAYACYLYGMQKNGQLGLPKAASVAALLGLIGGAALGSSSNMLLYDAVAGGVAAIACSGMLWILGIGWPAPAWRPLDRSKPNT